MTSSESVAVIGAGLAGCEAALVLAQNGVPVTLYESRPSYMSPAHTTTMPAELVCSNSFKSNKLPSAHGLLKAELNRCESPLLTVASRTSLRAGSALAVDREQFSAEVKQALDDAPLITFVQKEITTPPTEHPVCIIAAGPLASEPLTNWLLDTFSTGSLHFYDAIAPIVDAESIDMSIAFPASRWEDGEGDYINCPFSKEEYTRFYESLLEADKVTARSFENSRFFESCLPVEVTAQRGFKALAFGPLRPVGLTDPRTGRWPFAVCQLRREHASGECFNLVGFQTRLKIPEQQRVFRMIPGLENAVFLRYGSIHRNTYLESPKLLEKDLSFKKMPHLFLAGQLCGNEGYTESIATGHLAAKAITTRMQDRPFTPPPRETALGSLLTHVTASEEKNFTPTNIHFGLFPPVATMDGRRKLGKKERHQKMCDRALTAISGWLQ